MLIGTVLTLVAAFAIAGCGSSGSSGSTTAAESTSSGDPTGAEPVKLKMAIDPWIGTGAWYVAQAKGFDRKNGVDLEFISLSETSDFGTALASGEVALANTLVSQALTYQAAGLDLKTVLFEDNSDTADAILAQKDISSVKDLAGEKVGYEQGGGGEALLAKALEEAGMSFDDVETVNIPASAAGAALAGGKVSAAVTYEPYISELMKQSGDGYTTIGTAGEYPGIISDILLATNSFAEEHPEAVEGALRAWDEGVELFRSDPEEALKIVAEHTKTEPATLETSLEGVKVYNGAESLAFMEKDFSKLATETLELQEDLGTFEGEADPEALGDTTYLKNDFGG